MAMKKNKKATGKKAAPKKKKVAAKKVAPKKKKAVAKFTADDFKKTSVNLEPREMAVICNVLERSSVPGAKKLFSAFKAQKKL